MTARGWAVLGVCILCVSWAGAADSSLSIFEAARTGQLGAIETAIKGGASLNDRDDKGKTVLHYAAENGHVQTTQKLVQMGADPNIRDQAGLTPLDLAVKKGHEGTAEALKAVTSARPEAQASVPVVPPVAPVSLPVSERWELCLDAGHNQRPSVENGIVTLSIGQTDKMFPQYLNELGVERIRLFFGAQGNSQKSFSFIFSGGSTGPDQFEIRLDGRPVSQSPRFDTARQPDRWYRHEFVAPLGTGNTHLLEISSPTECQSSIEFSGIRMDDPTAPPYRPLCDNSIGSLAKYERELKAPGFVAQRPDLWVFAPATHQQAANQLADFLEKAYGILKELYADEPLSKFSVEIYPVGHPRARGGIFTANGGGGSIRYNLEALERFARVGSSGYEGFIGFTEEMSHGFAAISKCSRGTYEALGDAVQEDLVRRLVSREIADRYWLPQHQQWQSTFEAYRRAGFQNPDPRKYAWNILYTRILNHLFLNIQTAYGPNLWPDFFKLMKQKNYPLYSAQETDCMKIYADVFGELLHRDMRREFTSTYGIDLNANPPWGWQTDVPNDQVNLPLSEIMRLKKS